MSTIQFGIIGGGRRAEFYLRIARALPELFNVNGMVVRDAEKGQRITEKWGIPTFRTVEEWSRKVKVDFVVLSVPSVVVAPTFMFELAERNIAVLTETPPAPGLEELLSLHRLTVQGARIQVAEQYHLHPIHAARRAVITSGLLGTVSQARVAVAHKYHGISLLRTYLGAGFEESVIRGMQLQSPGIAGPNRLGLPTEEKTIMARQEVAWIQFGDKWGEFDFTSDQYFSWIRFPRVLIRGERGEICQNEVACLADFQTPLRYKILRMESGESDGVRRLQGFCLQGEADEERTIYDNPFAHAQLSDDEIAIAQCLLGMARYAQGGKGFYSLADASQDQYLALVMTEAIQTGEARTAIRQPWADYGERERI